MTEDTFKHLVETDWLEQHLGAPDIIVLDCSWHFPGAGNAPEEFEEEHIPGAIFFNIDEVADTTSPLPHMLPGPVEFSSIVRKMGIGDGMKIVVYDTYGFYCAAARVWWMFRAMGARDVVVLNGGMPKWLDEDRPTEEGWPLPRTERHFTARMDRTLLCELDEMTRIVEKGTAQIIDARSEARFTGEIGEPREGLKKGHIPGSLNIFFKDFLRFDGAFKPLPEMTALLARTDLDRTRPMVTTCGSGVTAAVINLLLAELGHEEVPLYDGSWAEWGRLDSPLPHEQDVD